MNNFLQNPITPAERIETLCDAFGQDNISDLLLLLHSLARSTTYMIEHAYPILKRVPGLDVSAVSDIDLHAKAIHFELNGLRSHLRALQTLPNTPKELIFIDDDVSHQRSYQERCSKK